MARVILDSEEVFWVLTTHKTHRSHNRRYFRRIESDNITHGPSVAAGTPLAHQARRFETKEEALAYRSHKFNHGWGGDTVERDGGFKYAVEVRYVQTVEVSDAVGE